jgi:hypothetical protein
MLLVDGQPAATKTGDGYAVPHGPQEEQYQITDAARTAVVYAHRASEVTSRTPTSKSASHEILTVLRQEAGRTERLIYSLACLQSSVNSPITGCGLGE